MAVSVRLLATAGSMEVNLNMETKKIAESAVVRLLLHSHTCYILVAMKYSYSAWIRRLTRSYSQLTMPPVLMCVM